MTVFVLAVLAIVYLGMAAGRLPGRMVDRTGVALLGAIALVLAGAMDGPAVLAAINFPTLVILFGRMVLSAQYAACGCYAWGAAANAGSAATVIGNPPNILIASVGALDFWAFAAVCAPPALAALVIV